MYSKVIVERAQLVDHRDNSNTVITCAFRVAGAVTLFIF